VVVLAGVVFVILCAVVTHCAAPFKVYVFDVGQADSQLIVYPSGYSIFIDAGELDWSANTNARMLAPKLRSILPTSYIDVIVLSHLHLDHSGYVGYGGLWWLIEKEGFTFGKIIDRDAGVWVDSNKNGYCDYSTEISWKYVGTLSGTSENWLCYATNPKNSKIFPYRQIAQICSTTQIAPPDAASSVTIVGSDAIGALMLDGTPVAADHSDEPIPPSENDFSIGLLVRYGRFSYGTFGDTDGEYETSVNGYYYDDIEAVVGPRIGHVDVYRVNHHGSSHSSSPGFLGTLTPSASIISCGYNNSYGHPDQEIVDRLLGYGSLYITEKGNLMNNYGTAVIASGDIVITSTDGGNTFTITAGSSTKTFTSRGAVPPKCVVQHHNRL